MLYIFLKTFVAKATEFSNTNIHQKVSNSNLYTMNLLRQFYCVPDNPQTCNLSAQYPRCWDHGVHLHDPLNIFIFGVVFLFVVSAMMEIRTQFSVMKLDSKQG